MSIRTFEAVTGPKADKWLVKTVGVLVSMIGLVLLRVAGKAPNTDVKLLAAGSALGLAGIDVYYSPRRRISRIYLFDALLELSLASLWAVDAAHTRGHESAATTRHLGQTRAAVLWRSWPRPSSRG